MVSDSEFDVLVTKVKKMTRRLSTNQLITLCENICT